MSFNVTGQVLTEWTKVTTSGATTIFTAGSSKTTIVSMRLKTISGTPNLTVVRHDAKNNVDYNLRNAEAVTANQEVAFDDVMTLEAGDTIVATSSTGDDFHCRVNYLAPSPSRAA